MDNNFYGFYGSGVCVDTFPRSLQRKGPKSLTDSSKALPLFIGIPFLLYPNRALHHASISPHRPLLQEKDCCNTMTSKPSEDYFSEGIP